MTVGRTRTVIRKLRCVSVMMLLVGCGSDGNTVSAGAGSGDAVVGPISGSLATLAVVDAGDGVLVVEGGVSHQGDDDRLRPAVTWLRTAGDVGVRFDLPFDEPLFDVDAWWTGSALAVIGLPCPSWTLSSGPPKPSGSDEHEQPPPAIMSKACGTDRYVTGTWDLGTKEWHEVPGVELRSDDSVGVTAAADDRALISTVEIEDAGTAAEERRFGHQIVDLGARTVTEAPPWPDRSGYAEVLFSMCLTSDGTPIGLMVWESEVPPALVDHGWDLSLAETAQTVPHPTQHLLALASSGATWVPVPLSGDVIASQQTPICSAGGFLVASGSATARIQVGAKAATAARIADLPPGEEQTWMESSLDPGAAPLAIGRRRPKADNPDGPQPSPLWRLDVDRWLPQGNVPYGSSWNGLATPSMVVTLVPHRTPNDDFAGRIVTQ